MWVWGLFTRQCTHKQMVADGVAPSAKARASAMVRFQKLPAPTDFFSRIEGTLVTKTIGFTMAQAKLHGIAQNIHAVNTTKRAASRNWPSVTTMQVTQGAPYSMYTKI